MADPRQESEQRLGEGIGMGQHGKIAAAAQELELRPGDQVWLTWHSSHAFGVAPDESVSGSAMVLDAAGGEREAVPVPQLGGAPGREPAGVAAIAAVDAQIRQQREAERSGPG